MTNIAKQIDQILDRRLGRGAYEGKGHINAVREKKKRLNIVLETLTNYSTLRSLILKQIEDGSGEYYAMSIENPESADAVRSASADETIVEIKKALEELDLLENRFGRDTINISVIGKAGQGKSRLLQSISGLDNEVIPAADGKDVTGTKSVLYNSPGQSEATAEVILYTEYELVEQIQKYLNELKMPVQLGAVSQIPSLQPYLEDFDAKKTYKTAREQSLFGHMRKYIEHFTEYASLIGKNVKIDKSQIREYVAQFDSQKRSTYKYLAVKEVHIYTEFNYPETGKIVLVDTIGLGDTSLGIREKLLATLRNDSDVAILVRMPSPTRDNIRTEDDELYDFISKAMGMEMLDKWLFFALNIREDLNNFDAVEAWEDALKSRKLRFADVKKANCSQSKDVHDNLILPILNHLVGNLDSVDENLLIDANKVLESAYMKYYELCAKAATVLNGGLKAALNSGGLFDELFEDKLGLTRELNALNQRYSDSDQDCEEIRTEVLSIVRGLASKCPTIDEIKIKLSEGGPLSHVDTAYNFYADNLRAKMRDALEKVNRTVITSIQDKVKCQIIDVLRDDRGGRLGRIVLMAESLDSPFVWLSTLIDQKVKDYPLVNDAFRNILDYRLNIEGLLEYKSNLALQYLDQESSKFTRLPGSVFGLPVQERAEIILQTLRATIPDIAKNLMEGIQELLRIPVHSFNAHIRKLRERIIFKQEGYRELKNFYRENATSIWNDEFSNVSKKHMALKGWKEQLETLNTHNRKENFVLTLSK